MLSVLPNSHREPGDPPALLTLDQAALLDVADPWRRSHLADELVKQLRALASSILQIRSEAVRELVHQHGAQHSRVARHLGVSRARISQLVAPATSSDTAEAVA